VFENFTYNWANSNPAEVITSQRSCTTVTLDTGHLLWAQRCL